MTREDITFNSDELGDIFGSVTTVKKEEPKKAEPKPDDITEPVKAAQKKTLVVQSKFAELETIAAKPFIKPEKAEVPKAPEHDLDTDAKELPGNPLETAALDAKGVEPARAVEFFDEIRKVFLAELESKIDKKVLENMMLRTLEKTAAANTILKNTNWDDGGNLRLNGSIDMARLMKNMETCPDKNTRDADLAQALRELLYLRLFSVKQGLGKDVYCALTEKIAKKAGIIEAGYSAGTSYYFRNNILIPAITKGDEIK